MKVYKDHSNATSKMNELLKEAGQEKPVMNLKEVETIVKTGHYTPLAPVKGFHIGINTAIVVSGIVISSFLAYMVLKVDKERETIKLHTAVSVQKPEEKTAIVIPSSEIKTAPELVNTNLIQLKQRPKAKAENLLASSDKNLIIPEKPAENIVLSEKPVENIAAISEKPATPRKILSGEFMITFNYNDQEIKMMLAGDDISWLSVDGRVVRAENYDNYREMIADGKDYLAGKHSVETDRNNLNLISFFDDQLLDDKLIVSDSPYTFQLTSSELLINKTAQSNEIFSKYKKLYETKTGKIITSGSSYRFERGSHSE